MSTYINVNNPKSNPDYRDCPQILKEYLIYMETIQNRSVRTINGYYIDLRTFFRFLKMHRGVVNDDVPFEEIDISDIRLEFVKNVTKSEIYEFLHFATRSLENAAATRARKTSSIKGYFKYLTEKAGYFKENPAADIEVPKSRKSLPKYLSLEESMLLLENVSSDFPERDYCILTLFLNCGMRLSELVGINLTDYKETNIRIIGKGNKERLVYLNKACISALDSYLKARSALQNIKADSKNAMFISAKTGKRLTPRRVQQIVNANLQNAGLNGKGYSAHKLRHTAATLMYRFGNADMLALKEILGHEHVSTTEIYTHISTKQLQNTVDSSPLAKVGFKPNKKSNGSAENNENSEKTSDFSALKNEFKGDLQK